MSKRKETERRQLEEHEPGATQEEVLATLAQVARTPKPQQQSPKNRGQ